MSVPDLLHGEIVNGYKRLPRAPDGRLTARCLSCDKVLSSRGIVGHVRACRNKKLYDQMSGEVEAAEAPHTCYEDNQGYCHTCGKVVNEERWERYQTGEWT